MMLVSRLCQGPLGGRRETSTADRNNRRHQQSLSYNETPWSFQGNSPHSCRKTQFMESSVLSADILTVAEHLRHGVGQPGRHERLGLVAKGPSMTAPFGLDDEEPGWPDDQMVDVFLFPDLDAVRQLPAMAPQPS